MYTINPFPVSTSLVGDEIIVHILITNNTKWHKDRQLTD